MPLGMAFAALLVSVIYLCSSSNFFKITPPTGAPFTEDFASRPPLSYLHSWYLQHLGDGHLFVLQRPPPKKETLELGITRNCTVSKILIKGIQLCPIPLALTVHFAQYPFIMTCELPIPPSHCLTIPCLLFSLASSNYIPWILILILTTLPCSPAVMLKSLKVSLFFHCMQFPLHPPSVIIPLSCQCDLIILSEIEAKKHALPHLFTTKSVQPCTSLFPLFLWLHG